MTRYVDQQREQFGVEPVCQALEIAPSTYYAARSRPPSARARSDAALEPEMRRVYDGNHDGVYGAYKLWRQLNREGVRVGRDRIARLMRQFGLVGVRRGKATTTTVPAAVGPRPQDLVKRIFKAPAPNRLWVADLTYVWTQRGFAYVAFVTDAFSRRIVGWRVSTSLRSDLALDALEMAIWSRGSTRLDGLVHHSDRGVQFLCIRYTERLADAGVLTSVGSKGDSYDNALAESVNGLYKTEVIRHLRTSWKSVEEVELATLRWVDWYNQRRLHGACGDIPPAEYEANYYSEQPEAPAA